MSLALLGGPPTVAPEYETFEHPQVHAILTRAVLNQLEEQISIYDDGGVYSRLENAFGRLFGRRYVLSVNSGTTALFSMYFSLELQPGDEVVVPAYTFFATATPLFQLGVVPVPADCGENGNVTAETMEAVLSERTKAVIVTHVWGIPCEMDAIRQVTSRNGVALLEDASHAHGATYHGKVVGTFGAGAAWSLQGKKIITAGEGGLFATDDTEMFERAVLLGHFNKRAHRNVTLPHLKPYRTTGLGLNLRMHPLGAALAYAQLATFKDQLHERREVAAFLAEEINAIEGLCTVNVPNDTDPAWYAFPILFDGSRFPGVSKERLVAAIHAEGAKEVDIPRSTCSLLRYPLFHDPQFVLPGYNGLRPPVRNVDCPNALLFEELLIKLPLWYGTDRMAYAEAYIKAIQKVCDQRSTLAQV